MRNLCFLCSAALIVVGLVGYLGWEAIGADKQSFTALIPAFVGTSVSYTHLTLPTNREV